MLIIGISDEIYTLTNDPHVRPSTNIIVSKNKAHDYLESTESPLENLITKHYEIFPNSSKYTGYVYDATLSGFLNDLVSPTSEPVAILGGINSNTEVNNDNATNVTNMKSTDTSFVGGNKTENFGIAVFKDDKLVGELTALETLCLSILQKKVNSFLIQVPDSENPNEDVDLVLYPSYKKNPEVKIVNGSPYITVDIYFIGRIYSMKADSKYVDDKVLEDLSSEANAYLEQIFRDYLYRTSTELRADINDFGKYALKNFLTIQDSENYDWQANFVNSVFKVNIDVSIKSGYIVTET